MEDVSMGMWVEKFDAFSQHSFSFYGIPLTEVVSTSLVVVGECITFDSLINGCL